MRTYFGQIKPNINDKVFLKDPDSSDLGRSIITGSITLIDELGFESFTIKKLGESIGSPESTIYRYFENKHRILLYVISWYWCWLEYRLVIEIANIESNEEKLIKAITLITAPVEEDANISHINEFILNRIVVNESFKAYHIKEVDTGNQNGFYKPYKRFVQRVGELVLSINPEFKYPHMLISTVVEGAHHQHFFAQHLPSLTDVPKNSSKVSDFYIKMVLATIQIGGE